MLPCEGPRLSLLVQFPRLHSEDGAARLREAREESREVFRARMQAEQREQTEAEQVQRIGRGGGRQRRGKGRQSRPLLDAALRSCIQPVCEREHRGHDKRVVRSGALARNEEEDVHEQQQAG